MNEKDVRIHVAVLGWFNLISSAIFLLVGVFGFLFLTGIGVFAGDPKATGILGMIGMAGLVLFGSLSLPGMAAGYGLLKRRSWSRILGIIVGVLGLFNIPIGTAIGVYALWVLTDEQVAEYLGCEAREEV